MTKLAAGFAAAVSPMTAETITTDVNGLIAGEVTIPTQDGQMPGDLKRPVSALLVFSAHATVESRSDITCESGTLETTLVMISCVFSILDTSP